MIKLIFGCKINKNFQDNGYLKKILHIWLYFVILPANQTNYANRWYCRWLRFWKNHCS